MQVDTEDMCHTPLPTPKDIITEFRNQIHLSKRGLDLVFELYKDAFDKNTQVSRVLRTFF
jgi:hypothetical protein